MNRRLSLEDEEAPAVPAQNQGANAPPAYLSYKPGSKAEFFRDIDGYQAACLIKKTILGDEAPAYESLDQNDISAALPNNDDTRIFRFRFLEVLIKLKDFVQHTQKRGTCFGISDIAHFILSIVAMLALVAGIAVWMVFMRTIFVFFLITMWVSIFGYFIYMIWKYRHKKILIKDIEVALIRVENFQRLDEKTVESMKDGVTRVVPLTYWIGNETRLKAHRSPRS